MSVTNREICLKAAQRLREVGWQQGDFGDKGGPHCMIGACQWAVGWYDNDIPAIIYPAHDAANDPAHDANDAAHNAASTAVYNVARSLRAADWNDTPGRTVEEVIAVLEACP